MPEDVKYKKNAWWYVISLVVLALGIWWSKVDSNPIFAVFLILFYLVILIYEFREVREVEFVITPDGVKVGKNFHYYPEFSNFYVIYEDRGVKNLYLEFKNPLKGRLIIPLDGQNPLAIREYLLAFLAEDLERGREPISERIRRWLRL